MRKFKRISGLLAALGLFLCSCGSGVTSGTSDFHGTLSQSGSEIVQGDFEIDFDQGRVTGTGSVLFPEQDEIEGVIDGTFTESDNGDKSGTFTLTTPAGETFTFNFTASGSGMTGNYTVSDGETGNFAAVLDSTGTAAGFYEDLFLRQDLFDDGAIPNPHAGASQSPDIIVTSTPFADPTSLTTAASYAKSFDSNIVEGNVNYIYVRAKNSFKGREQGTVTLYYADPALLLPPSLWQNNVVATIDGNRFSRLEALAAGQIAVTTLPFALIPQFPTSGGLSFIASISTQTHPSMIPSIRSFADYAQWIRNNPAIAMRTVQTYPTTMPSTQATFAFQNFDPSAQTVTFAVNTQNLTGSRVALFCSSPGPNPPIILNPTNVSTSPQTFSLTTNVPAGFACNITLVIQNSGLPASGASASVAVYWNMNPAMTDPSPMQLMGQGTVIFRD